MNLSCDRSIELDATSFTMYSTNGSLINPFGHTRDIDPSQSSSPGVRLGAMQRSYNWRASDIVALIGRLDQLDCFTIRWSPAIRLTKH